MLSEGENQKEEKEAQEQDSIKQRECLEYSRLGLPIIRGEVVAFFKGTVSINITFNISFLRRNCIDAQSKPEDANEEQEAEFPTNLRGWSVTLDPSRDQKNGNNDEGNDGCEYCERDEVSVFICDQHALKVCRKA